MKELNYKKNILSEQIYCLKDFLFHYTSYRIINNNFDDLIKRGSIEFWIYTLNAHYYQSVNLWCMIFGSEKNEIHWKKLSLNQELESLINSEITDYTTYKEEVTKWRNKLSAHRNPNVRLVAPDLKKARQIVFIYEKWLHRDTDESIKFFLQHYENKYAEEVEKTIKTILL